ncbi:MAG: FAD-dependent oxidoreductase [Shinella zoogloeoides]|uniref:FAD-dependent oxidoreductase n=1 Tax=Shinella zoogloeoides TaxID=352475 RepID=UPI003C743DE2
MGHGAVMGGPQTVPFDVAVIGGGITGASAANHLAAAGFSTVLLERADFAGGTSSRSSRLQHCGLTYFSPGRSIWNFLRNPRMAIEHMELARRAMRDRSGFVRATPARARAIGFYMPLYRREGIPLWKARLGFALLRALDPGGVPLDFKPMSAREIAAMPALSHLRDRQDLSGVIRFTEYQFDWPERICVDTVLNARDLGAVTRNYTEVTSVRRQPDGRWRLELLDRRTQARETLEARAVVNAAGAWVDGIAAASGLPVPKINQGLKGTNVVVRLPPEFRGIAIETALPNGDPFYVIPWRDLHYFGPRDEPHEPEAAGFRADEATIRGLLDDFNSVFPDIALSRQDVLYSWAGVRPRTARAGHPDGCEAVLLHDMAQHGAPGYFVYTGGLIMTHRHAGASIAKALSGRMAPSGPARAISHAARQFPQAAGAGFSTGGEAIPLDHLRFSAAHEQVVNLDDLMFRRFPIGWSEGMGLDVAEAVAEGVSDVMGWSPAEVGAQVRRYRAQVAQDFGVGEPCT